MFGKNQITGQKFFADAPKDSIMVTSMFYTIQGEGPYMGQPAYFFRLSKCNLNCSFCDAFFDQGEYYHYTDLIEKMEEDVATYFKEKGKTFPSIWYSKWYKPLVVITGGEPTIQPNLYGFIEELQNQGHIVQIETNGVLTPNVPDGTTVVCSPKCSEKTGKYLTVSDETLERVNVFKFVVSADPTSPYHTIPEWVNEKRRWGNWSVYVSPMNVYERLPNKARGTGNLDERSTKDEIISFWEPGLLDLKQNQLNHEYAARLCLENDYILNLQMHLYASLA